MAKDKKAKKAEQKARTAAKQSKKAAKGEKKAKAKGPKDADSDAEDVDLDAVLASFAEKQAQFLKVTETPTQHPSPRSSATLLASPSNRNELLVFGGEYYDGTTAVFYNDLFVYLINKGEWRTVTSPNSPLPRSGHAWCRGGNQGGIYLFGGEFSSPKQGTFYHYNDFWSLDPSSREWSRIEVKGKSPPARSGHRMTHFKQYVVLFGGFQDTSQQTKYLQDLWIYDSSTFMWHNPSLPPASQKPDPRSSFSFLPHESGAVLYGGYSRVKAMSVTGKQNKPGTQKAILKPIIHQDTWILRIKPPDAGVPSNSPPALRWERRKRPVNSPNPSRAGATMAYHKGRGIMFGGVHDVEETEEGIESDFFDTLFAWNVDRNRFFPLPLRRARAPGKKQQAPPQNRTRNRGKADEEELLRNLAALETKGSTQAAVADEMDLDPASDSDEFDEKFTPTTRFEMPHPRFNAQLAVQDDSLYIFGGTFERGDQEFTFNDLYAIDLGKMDGVKQHYYVEPENWNVQETAEDSDEEMDDDDDDNDDDESRSSDEETMEKNQTPLIDAPSTAPTETPPPPSLPQIKEEDETEEQDPQSTSPSSSISDPRPLPRPFEPLRAFFARTTTDWQALALANLRIADPSFSSSSSLSVKELRRISFEMADSRWWDCREEVQALEEEQEGAGIGEVVEIGSGGGRGGEGSGGGGGGRRR